MRYFNHGEGKETSCITQGITACCIGPWPILPHLSRWTNRATASDDETGVNVVIFDKNGLTARHKDDESMILQDCHLFDKQAS